VVVGAISLRQYFMGLPFKYRQTIRTIFGLCCHHSNGNSGVNGRMPLYPQAGWYKLPQVIILTILEWSLPPLNLSPIQQYLDHSTTTTTKTTPAL
jgi:hypothetical protein